MALGISMHAYPADPADPEEIDLMALMPANVRWVRSDFVWDRTTTPDSRNALWVDTAHALGLRTLMIIDWWSFTNAWTTDLALTNETALRVLIEKIVNNCPDVDAWEIWNEPNLGVVGDDPPWANTYIDATSHDYAEFLKICGDEIHKHCPSSQVVAGAMGNWTPPIEPVDMVQEIIDSGADKYCEAISIHCWDPSRDLSDLAELRSTWGKALWISEYGLASAHGHTDADQVSSVEYMTTLESYVDVIFWYCLSDYTTRGGAEDHFGILDTSQAQKPSWTAFNALVPRKPITPQVTNEAEDVE